MIALVSEPPVAQTPESGPSGDSLLPPDRPGIGRWGLSLSYAKATWIYLTKIAIRVTLLWQDGDVTRRSTRTTLESMFELSSCLGS